MNVEASRTPSRTTIRPAARWLGVVGTIASGTVAQGQTVDQSKSAQIATGAVVRSGLMQAIDRLDPLATVLIAGAVVILGLIAIRISIMVRGERRSVVRPPPTQRPPRTATSADEPLGRPTLTGSTDWGHDQNARAALARESVPVAASPGDLPSLDQAVTQWTISEVHHAANVSRGANESMGRPPDLPPSPYRTAFNPYYRGEPTKAHIEVVEVADTLLQAELLVQLGDPKQAMTLLSNHIRDTEKPGPAVWLMLLDLYQTTGRKSQYEALSNGFKTLFNAEVPSWAATRDMAARDLESYPQVMMKLHTQWNAPTLRGTLEALLNDDRGGSRQGFSLAAYRDLLFLLEIVDQLDKMQREDDERDDIQRKLGRSA